jgi:CopG family nickel-responsive transcriptional regulator
MDRFTISLPEELAKAFDELIAERGYTSRSEAVRDLLRDRLGERAQHGKAHGQCVASLSYVYNHHERALSERLADLQHSHHEMTVATMHAHLDHGQCLETVMLKGSVSAVQGFADALTVERAVRHGRLNLIAVDSGSAHRHDGHKHRHLTPHL